MINPAKEPKNSPTYKVYSHTYIDTMGYTSKQIEQFAIEFLDLSTIAKLKDLKTGITDYPSFELIFYSLLNEYQAIPGLAFYTHEYETFNFLFFQDIKGHEKLALWEKIKNEYAKLLRAIHFYHYVKESGKFEGVQYTLEKELENKLNIFVKKSGKWYGLNLYGEKLKPDPAAKYEMLSIKLGDGSLVLETLGEPIKLWHEAELIKIYNKIIKHEDV